LCFGKGKKMPLVFVNIKNVRNSKFEQKKEKAIDFIVGLILLLLLVFKEERTSVGQIYFSI